MPPQQRCASQTGASIEPHRLQPKQALTDFGMQPYSHMYSQFPVLMVSTLVIHVNTWHGLLFIYWSQRDGRLSWPTWQT